MDNQLKIEQRHRCLKPSVKLYGAVVAVMLIICLAITLVFSSFGWALLVTGLFGASPLVLVRPVAMEITRKAEYRNIQPNSWYIVDVEKEKRRFGPFRARRMSQQDGLSNND